MNRSFGGLAILVGIISACIGGYFLLKKYNEEGSQIEDIPEEKKSEKDAEESSNEMPLRGSESDSKTSLEEPMNLDSYKDFLKRKTAYMQNNVSDEFKKIFEKKEEDSSDQRFLMVDSSYNKYYTANEGSYYNECVLLFEEGDDLVLKNEELEELDEGDVGNLKEFLRGYCSAANGSDWTEIYVLDTFMNTVYFVNRMDE